MVKKQFFAPSRYSQKHIKFLITGFKAISAHIHKYLMSCVYSSGYEFIPSAQKKRRAKRSTYTQQQNQLVKSFTLLTFNKRTNYSRNSSMYIKNIIHKKSFKKSTH